MQSRIHPTEGRKYSRIARQRVNFLFKIVLFFCFRVHGRNEQIVKAEANEKIDEFIKENDILRPKMELVVKKEECNENSASVSFLAVLETYFYLRLSSHEMLSSKGSSTRHKKLWRRPTRY